ncbi:class I SAM-dependent methyltransferase [Parahaliea mediterranea]|uniref:Class I SAM-dependent methyltransferase n=1 Tax=Parahaliea mediterranea TaxID=651086 RepID=A0A939IKA4_9GAMM|nr:class I SAM-dependent methyltransferase [Parahaliea mediterranea]MBN7795255.1 class I SAM-dependent methyltransferase [Parahaliea mediterranea]
MPTNTTCRSCHSDSLYQFLDLGRVPLADGLVSADDLEKDEPRFPLVVAFCRHCALVQILETVAPETLFSDDYPYYSSFSPYILKHSKANVDELIERRKLGPRSFVVELASNDGYLLKNYVDAGVPVLGIDPAKGPVEAANNAGVHTLHAFFGESLARQLANEGKRADIIHGNNVLAHVADTNGFVSGIATLLKDDGVAVIEAPYVKNLIDNCEFDTIYHEHLCYFSVTSAKALFKAHGLYLNDVKWLPIHGGSLRYYCEKSENVSDNVSNMLESEHAVGLDRSDYYHKFSQRVATLKNSVNTLLADIKAEGKSIAAYGAAAKGATLINYMEIGTDTLDFVVDRNVHKQGRYMPGHHIPIKAPEALIHSAPDYVLMLAWNFADEILAQQQRYLEGGGRFIVPVPEPRVL